MDHDGWFGYVYPKNLDKQELSKIGVPQTVNRLQAFIDPGGELYFNNVRINGILPRDDGAFSLWYLLGLLNSAALDYCFRLTAKPKDRDYFEANKQFIAPLPIPDIKPAAQKPVAALAKELAELHGKREQLIHQVRQRFATDLAPAKLIADQAPAASLPGKLRDFYTLEMKHLLDAMEDHAGTRLSPGKRETWQQYLSGPIESIQRTINQISDKQARLDELVFALYGLSAQQIATIKSF